jgi:hypothetical protein
MGQKLRNWEIKKLKDPEDGNLETPGGVRLIS